MNELLLRRRNVVISGASSLPYDAEIEYLACTGNGEKIDTGFYPTEKTRVTGKVLFTGQRGTFFCSQWTSNGNTNIFAFYAATNNLVALADHDGTQYRLVNILTYNNNRFNNVLDIDFNTTSVSVKLNGTSLYSRPLSRGTTYTSTSPIIFFYLSDANITACRIYGAKIYENGVLSMDFIPVRVGQVGYMYDKVSGQLFGNAGTGNFVLGNDVN